MLTLLLVFLSFCLASYSMVAGFQRAVSEMDGPAERPTEMEEQGVN